MHLIALLIGLIVERLATQLFHLRRLGWLDRLIDRGLDRLSSIGQWPALVTVIALGVLLILPVALVIAYLGGALFGFPFLIVSVVVLFFSLGPNDIGEEVSEYCDALESGDDERIRDAAEAIVEDDVPAEQLARCHCVESAVVVQANNRLFAVIFWFVLLGPLGAWAYRVSDLMRRRALNASHYSEEDRTLQLGEAAMRLHGWLAFVPARLTALGYATAGNFDEAWAAWRETAQETSATLSRENERLLSRVGLAALDLDDDVDDLTERSVSGATAARRLVFRLLLIWGFVIAAMTLYGWTH